MIRSLALVLILFTGTAMAVENKPRAEKPRGAVSEDQAGWDHAERFGALLEQQYQDKKAGKPWSEAEWNKRVREIGGEPNWPKLRQRGPEIRDGNPAPDDINKFPF
jgi:hypothetical protein